jgi:hypothetical protein
MNSISSKLDISTRQVENFFEAVGMTESLVTDSTSNYDTVENMSRGYYRDFGGELAKMPAAAYK